MKVDPLRVVSVVELTVFVVEGSLTFPLVFRIMCVCVVPNVQNVEMELVDSMSLLP